MIIRSIFILFLLLLNISFAQNISANSRALDENNVYFVTGRTGSLWDNYGEQRGEEFIAAQWYKMGYVSIFNHSAIVLGKVNNQLSSGFGYLYSTYSPGPIIDGQAAMVAASQDSLRYHVYKITSDSYPEDPDYASWPSDLGAPLDAEGFPKLYGDAMLWTVYNNADESIPRRMWNFEDTTISYCHPSLIEIQQKVYVHGDKNQLNVLSDCVFIEYLIINKGNVSVDSAYFGLFSDIDMGSVVGNEIPAIDTSRQLAYMWEPDDMDGDAALGYTMLYGPIQYEKNANAVFNGRRRSDHKNIKISAFMGVYDDSYLANIGSLAWSEQELFNYARGLDKDGNPIFDPVANRNTPFTFPGDPVSNSGWLANFNSGGGGGGFYFFCGPFDLAASDSQWVMLVICAAQGENNLDSIVKLRKKIDLLRQMPYDSLAFGNSAVISDMQGNKFKYENRFTLKPNYPNPFNPTTIINYELRITNDVKLVIYDVLGREVVTLVDEKQRPGHYHVTFDATGLASGIYYYRLNVGAHYNAPAQTRKMLLLK